VGTFNAKLPCRRQHWALGTAACDCNETSLRVQTQSPTRISSRRFKRVLLQSAEGPVCLIAINFTNDSAGRLQHCPDQGKKRGARHKWLGPQDQLGKKSSDAGVDYWAPNVNTTPPR